MLTAVVDGGVCRASAELKGKGLAFRCRDERCEHPELELVIGSGCRIPYFRHKRRGKCGCPDGETEWHLAWKSQFEKIEVDMGLDPTTGEHNRADAVVGDDFVLEFQHSAISVEEQMSRERFYGARGGMLWIVDANKRNALARLRKMEGALEPFTLANIANHYELKNPDAYFPPGWQERGCSVVFDYGPERQFVRLYAGRTTRDRAVVEKIDRTRLIEELKKDPQRFRKTVVGAFGLITPEQSEEFLLNMRRIEWSAASAEVTRPEGAPRKPFPKLLPTHEPFIFLDENGRECSNIFGKLLPMTAKYRAAIKRELERVKLQERGKSNWALSNAHTK